MQDGLSSSKADAPAALREKKAALLEVMELQKQLIAAHEAAELEGSGEGDDADLQWYAEQGKRLEQLKASFNAIRLQPDEFQLLVPQAWAVGADDGAAVSSRELVPYVLRLSARSQLTFVPAPVAIGGGASASLIDADEMGASSGSVPRVFFMDALRQVRLEGGQRQLRHDAAASTDGAAASSPAAVRSSVGAARELSIVLGSRGCSHRLRCVTPEAAELVEVLGAHLRRYNASRVALVESLRRAHALKCTAYDGADAEHERLLRRLWACGFGADGPACELVSERWVHLGFQTPDPTKDFRGMGLLGLTHLVYFGETFPDVFHRLVAAQRKRDYPLACAGINVTSLLLELLCMKEAVSDAAVGEPVGERPPFSELWDGSDMFHFFCHMFYRERALEDTYCFALRLLDRMFVTMDADYSTFPDVLSALRTRLLDALSQRPLSFREFKRLVSASHSVETDSAYSGHSISSAGTGSSLADDGAESERELARVVSEALASVPRSLERLRTGWEAGTAAGSAQLSAALSALGLRGGGGVNGDGPAAAPAGGLQTSALTADSEPSP